MDVHAVNSLPEDLKSTFCKLLTHAYSIDTHAQKLILDLIKLVVHCFDEEGSGTPPAETTCADNTPNLHPEDTKDNSAELNVSTDGAIGVFSLLIFSLFNFNVMIYNFFLLLDGDNLGYSSQYELQRSRLYSTPNVKCHS